MEYETGLQDPTQFTAGGAETGGGLCMTDAKPESTADFLCLPGATWAGFSSSSSSDKERETCFSQHLCTASAALTFPATEAKVEPPQQYGRRAARPALEKPPTLGTGPEISLISQMQTHRHREWMNLTQKMLPVRAESRQGKKKKKKKAYHANNSLPDSLIWIH